MILGMGGREGGSTNDTGHGGKGGRVNQQKIPAKSGSCSTSFSVTYRLAWHQSSHTRYPKLV